MFLKTLANATYGVFAEMRRLEEPEPVLEIHGLQSFELTNVEHPEHPGEYCFPPIASLITAAARLMLAILQRLVEDQGGTYAFCDTDSMAIVATPAGGLVRCPGGPHTMPDGQASIEAVSADQVKEIVAQLAALNPYNRTIVPGSILKIEDANYARRNPGSKEVDHDKPLQLYAYAISPKRYPVYNLVDGQVDIRDYKEHGLGYLLGPLDPDEHPSRKWIKELWEYLIYTDALGQKVPQPEWLRDREGRERIAMGQITFSTPELMTAHKAGSPYSGLATVLPHTFVLSPPTAAGGHPVGAKPAHFQLIAGYTRDPTQWPELECVEKHTGHRYRISPDQDRYKEGRPRDLVYVKTYRHVLNNYRRNANPTSLGADGKVAGPETIGLLRPRPVQVTGVDHIGAETKLADEMSARVIHDETESLRVWGSETQTLSPCVKRVLLTMPIAEGTKLSGFSEKTVKRIRQGTANMSRPAREQLELRTARWARDQLLQTGVELPRRDLFGRWLRSERARERMKDDPQVTQLSPQWSLPRDELLVVLATWAEQRASFPACKCGCGKPITGRRSYHDRACQVRAYRSRKADRHRQ